MHASVQATGQSEPIRIFGPRSEGIGGDKLGGRLLRRCERFALLGRMQGRAVFVIHPGRTSTGFGRIDDVARKHGDVTTSEVENALTAREEVARPVTAHAGRMPAPERI